MPALAGIPDWRDASAYADLLELERSGFAWEWLRRQREYRAAALEHPIRPAQRPLGVIAEQPAATCWGLHVFEDPAVSSPRARPIWRAERCAFVLQATAERAGPGSDSVKLDDLRRFARMARGAAGEHLLLSDGYRSIRLDVRGASARAGPVMFRFEIAGLATLRRELATLHRLVSLASTGRFSPRLHPPDRRARRQILLLRAHDALAVGADQRTIAAQLLSKQAAGQRWRVRSPSLRSQAQRLVRSARQMAQEGFWQLLR
jgi:hypothetical protein